MHYLAHNADQTPFKIFILPAEEYPSFFDKQENIVQTWLTATSFKPTPRKIAFIPDAQGALNFVLFIEGDPLDSFWDGAALAEALPQGVYQCQNVDKDKEEKLALSWGISAYSFDLYKKNTKTWPTLIVKDNISLKDITSLIAAIHLTRDLINTPAADMGPQTLESQARTIANRHNATCTIIQGPELQKEYPMIYGVGKAGEEAPRLIDLRWGTSRHPKVVLVGKGVCFDTGGLNIKPDSSMRHMKKDMGGAAHVLALAQLIMAEQLPVSLRVLIPAVENNIAANAMRPGDIFQSRKGLTVEIGHTDAEGRLILADALTEACAEKPTLIIDCATLTGAARIALGPSLPALFTNQDSLAKDLMAIGEKVADPLWHMPLWESYRSSLKSSLVADLDNTAGNSGLGGAITAALFLSEFLEKDIPWIHIDMMAWNLKSLPGRPIGGEAQTLRALFTYLKARFS